MRGRARGPDGKARMRGRRGLATVAGAGLVLGVALSCDGGPAEPGEGPAGIALALSIEGASASPAAAFDKADRLVVRVTPQGGTLVERVCPIETAQQTVECSIADVNLPEGEHHALVGAALQLGSDPIFSGEQTVDLTPGQMNRVALTLAAVPHHIQPSTSSVQLSNIGEQAQLEASVVFVTGDAIPGQTLTWSTSASGIDLTSSGLVTARSNGTYQVEARSGDLTVTVGVVVAAVATLSSVTPSSVALGRTTTLQLDGSNLHGATGVFVCGAAAVGPPTVASDGTSVTVTVTWPAYNPGSQATSSCSVAAATPQGSAAGTIGLSLVAPPPAATLLSRTDAAGTWVTMWDPAAGTFEDVAGPFPHVENLRLAPGGGTATMGMSPDGTIPGTDAYEVDLSTGALTVLTAPASGGGHNTHFIWDPTAAMGVFRRCDGTGCWLWDWVGGSESNRGVDGCNPTDPEYRQAGQLLYTSEYDAVTDTCAGHRIQRWGSSEPQNLTGGDPAVWDAYPRLSPDGSTIAFIRRSLSTGQTDLMTMASNGSGEVMHREGVGWVAWADDDWILYTAGGVHALHLPSGLSYWLLGGNIAHVDRR